MICKIPKIWVFEHGKINAVTMKHVDNVSVIFIESYVVHFDINGLSNLSDMEPMIGMQDMMSHTWGPS